MQGCVCMCVYVCMCICVYVCDICMYMCTYVCMWYMYVIYVYMYIVCMWAGGRRLQKHSHYQPLWRSIDLLSSSQMLFEWMKRVHAWVSEWVNGCVSWLKWQKRERELLKSSPSVSSAASSSRGDSGAPWNTGITSEIQSSEPLCNMKTNGWMDGYGRSIFSFVRNKYEVCVWKIKNAMDLSSLIRYPPIASVGYFAACKKILLYASRSSFTADDAMKQIVSCRRHEIIFFFVFLF
jgi:hypothetical protein